LILLVFCMEIQYSGGSISQNGVNKKSPTFSSGARRGWKRRRREGRPLPATKGGWWHIYRALACSKVHARAHQQPEVATFDAIGI
jgi:hypothetical protein